MIRKSLENALNDAFVDAQMHNHPFVTLEHLLYAISVSEEGRDILENSGVNIERLQHNLTQFFESFETPNEQQTEPIQTTAFQRVLQRGLSHVRGSSKQELDFGDILMAIFEEEDCYARYFIEEQGVEKYDILNYVAHGISKKHDDIAHFSAGERDIFDDIEDFDETEFPATQQSDKKINQEKILEKYAIDMTALAAEGKYDRLIGREEELKRTIEILCRRQKNNPIHVGDPGVGKTAITQGLAQKLVRGDVPDRLKGYRLFSIEIGTMLAGTKFRGDFEERMRNVFAALKKIGKAIVFIDEIHTIVGAGSVSSGNLDAANLLKPLLTTGELRVIGSTTYEEYRQYFEKDRALSRRFQKIDVKEPTADEAMKILQGLIDRYQEYHGVKYEELALRSAVDLSQKYLRERYLPDKAIDLIDEAGATVSIYNNKKIVTQKDIEDLIARLARIPRKNLNHNDTQVLAELEQNLKKNIFGQDEAIAAIVSAIKRHRAGLASQEKPVGNFLFIGPTGVGKTELCRQLAHELGIELIRFDMSEYNEKHTISRLLGSPPGYVGFNQGALLTDAVRKHPHCVLLLDEIEKAHPDIFNSLLQVMDHASITDATGCKADFRNVILIMTSNAGSAEMSTNVIGFAGTSGGFVRKDPKAALKNFFSPEFLNRIDKIAVFGHLPPAVIQKIVKKLLRETEQLLTEKNITIKSSDAAIAWLAEKGYDENLGARPLARLIQETVKDRITDEILFGALKNGGKVVLDVKKGKLVVQATSSAGSVNRSKSQAKRRRS